MIKKILTWFLTLIIVFPSLVWAAMNSNKDS